MNVLVLLLLCYIYGSLVEWVIHKFLLHKGTSLFANAHRLHHKAYSPHHFDSPPGGDDRFKNLVVCLEHMLVFYLPASVLLSFLSALAGTFLLGFGVFHYYFYNHIHTVMHVGGKTHLPSWARKMIFFNHFMHHQYPADYYCVTLPGMDYILGTFRKLTAEDHESFEKVWKEESNVNQDEVNEGINKLDRCWLSSRWFKNGYVPENTGPIMSKLRDFIYKVIEITQIGNVIVKPQKMVPNSILRGKRQVLLSISHKSWKDIFIINKVFPRVKLMAAQSVMKFCGLGFILGPLFNCFAATGGDNQAAVRGSVDALNHGDSVAICSSGWVDWGYNTLPFKNGTVRIYEQALKQNPILCIVPVKIDYGRYPEKDIFDLPFILQVVKSIFGNHARSGAIVKIGQPLYRSDLPDDVEDATVELQRIVETL